MVDPPLQRDVTDLSGRTTRQKNVCSRSSFAAKYRVHIRSALVRLPARKSLTISYSFVAVVGVVGTGACGSASGTDALSNSSSIATSTSTTHLLVSANHVQSEPRPM